MLGIPFLNSIYPIRVDNQGLRTTLLDREIFFEFTDPPDEGNINTLRDQVIKAKEDHVNHLRQEINLVSSSMPFVEDFFPINLSIIETNPFHKESWFLKSLCEL